MSIIFKCNNKDCKMHPCLVSCDKAYSPGEYGDEGLETPTVCAFMDISDENSDFAVLGKCPRPGYSEIPELEEWYSEHYDEIPEEIRNAIDNCEFRGDQARTDYMAVIKFSNLMQSAELDEDRWKLQEQVDEICKKFKKNEILIAALHNGYRIGLLQTVRFFLERMKDK